MSVRSGRGRAWWGLCPIVLAATMASAEPDPCAAADFQQRLASARAEQNRLDDEAAAARLASAGPESASTCPALSIARLAAEGWVEARRLATIGGAPEAMETLRRLLAQIEKARAGRPSSSRVAQQAAYAEAVLRAAAAAAQDERDEMQLYLAHARSLAESLALAGEPRPWPLPIDLAEGELLFEVDRYQDSLDALVRVSDPALQDRVAFTRGLAWQRLGDEASACGALARVAESGLPDRMKERAREALGRLSCRR